MAGNGRGAPKKGTRSKKKWFKKNVMSVKRRGKDLDQVQDELRELAESKRSLATYKDEDAPGGGEAFCVECSRHFISAAVLEAHSKTRDHRRMLKLVAEPQYTQREADAGAGASASR
jgi:bud site selection protein 20